MRKYLILGLLLSACSSGSVKPPVSNLSELELYMVRPSLTMVEFEQYKLFDNSLFYECGKLNGSRHVTSEENIRELTPAELTDLNDIIGRYSVERATSKVDYDKPGKNRGFSDPGTFTLSVKSEPQIQVRTAFDSINKPKSKVEFLLQKLALKIRSLAGKPCGNVTFYGLGRS